MMVLVLVQYSRDTVPYRTVHQLTCRVDGGAALGMRTVLYCTTCRYGSPHYLTVCVRYAFGMPDSCRLPPCMHAGRGTRTSAVLYLIPRVFVPRGRSYISRTRIYTRGRSYGTVLHYM